MKHKNTNESTLRKYFLSTAVLFYSFFLIGSSIILLGILLGERPYATVTYTRTILLLGVPWLIAACTVVVVRKEVPRLGLRNITGNWAVFQGVLGLTACGSAEVFLLYDLLREILSK
jgi:hypothetical protein